MPDSITGGGGVPRLSGGEFACGASQLAVEMLLCGVPSFGVYVKEGVSVQDRCWGTEGPFGVAPKIELVGGHCGADWCKEE